MVTGIDSNGVPNRGSFLRPGVSGWYNYSDRSFKENFEPVGGRDLLDRLARVPVLAWNYKSQDPAIRQIGPLAQEFNDAFGVGGTGQGGAKKFINSMDADGVALAGVQALYQINQEQAEQIQALQDRLARMEKGGTGDLTAGQTISYLPWAAMALMAFKLGWTLRSRRITK
jgi:hypothetical protein